jgi:hypothetical protein
LQRRTPSSLSSSESAICWLIDIYILTATWLEVLISLTLVLSCWRTTYSYKYI